MNYLAVKDFASFQHYKDRNPPWIKLYFAILEDYTFLQLAEVTQRHLIMLWLIASRYEGFLPDDRKYLTTAIKARGRVDFATLIASGFLAVVDEDTRAARLAERTQSASTHASTDASAMLDNRTQAARPSRARESQRQSTETDPPTPPPAAPGRRGTAAPWMGEIRRIWADVFPDGAPPKGAAKLLGAIVDRYGIERVAAELGAYLRATQPQYLNLPKFCATFGGSAVAGTIPLARTPAAQEAEKLWALCKKYGFVQCTRNTITGELERAKEAGDIDDIEAFRATLRRLDIPFLRVVQSDRAAVQSIADRLAAVAA